MNLTLKRTPGIYVVGFMGAGKSTVGRLLAERLGWSFSDIDTEIERAEKTTIMEIFAAQGEENFRRLETEMIRQHVRCVECGKPAVLALGGGAFTIEQNRDLLKQNGVTIWLDCPLETAARRVAAASHRPLARDPQQFAALYEARRQFYAMADIRIEIDCDEPAKVVDAILSHPELR